MNRMAPLALILVAAIVAVGCVVIEDGEVGVSKSLGKIKTEPIGQGVVIQVPLFRTVETWNTKLQELKETAQVPSSEGLIVDLDTSLLFRVTPESAPMIRRTVGWNYVDLLITPYFRSALRDVVSGYSIKKVYSQEGRKEIASKVKGFLEENLEPRGIIVVDVLLREVKLPQRFRDSIEAKLTAEQRVQLLSFDNSCR